LAYNVDGILFVKEAAYDADAAYFDYGSSSECYCGAAFIELETLGPRVVLQPGQSTAHREVWSLHDGVEITADEDAAAQIAADLAL
jgi:hypothetical protein